MLEVHIDVKRGERLFKDIRWKDRSAIVEEYCSKWTVFAELMKAKVFERMADDGIRKEDKMENFLNFKPRSDCHLMMEAVLESLKYCQFCTITMEMVIDVMMELGTFGLAKTLIENYVINNKENRLEVCMTRMVTSTAVPTPEDDGLHDEKKEEECELAADTEEEEEHLDHFRQALMLLFDAQIALKRMQQEKKDFYKSARVLRTLKESFSNLSRMSPVTTFPSQNLMPEVLSFLMEKMSNLTNKDRNSFYVGKKLELKPQPGKEREFLRKMGVLARHSLWCKGTSKVRNHSLQACVDAEDIRENIMQELTVLSQLRHPNVVCLAGVLISPDSVYLLLHMHGSGKNLEDHLNNPQISFPGLSYLQLIMRQVCSALEFMHLHSPYALLHNNVNLSNVVADEMFVNVILVGFGQATTAMPCISWDEPWQPQEGDVRAVGRTVRDFMNHLERRDPNAFTSEQSDGLLDIIDEILDPSSTVAEVYNVWTINQKLQDLTRPCPTNDNNGQTH